MLKRGQFITEASCRAAAEAAGGGGSSSGSNAGASFSWVAAGNTDGIVSIWNLGSDRPAMIADLNDRLPGQPVVSIATSSIEYDAVVECVCGVCVCVCCSHL